MVKSEKTNAKGFVRWFTKWFDTELKIFCLVFFVFPTLLYLIGVLMTGISLIPIFPDLVWDTNGVLWEGIIVFYLYLFYLPFILYNFFIYCLSDSTYKNRFLQSISIYLSNYLVVVITELLLLSLLLFDIKLFFLIGMSNLSCASVFIAVYRFFIRKN